MKNQTKIFRAEVSEEREEANCSECKERFHLTELVNLNERYQNHTYTSLVCVDCKNCIRSVLEAKSLLNDRE